MAEIEKRLRGRLDELVTLYQLPHVIRSHRETDKLLNFIAHKVASIMEVSVCTLRLFNQEEGFLQLKAAFGLRPFERRVRRDLKLGESVRVGLSRRCGRLSRTVFPKKGTPVSAISQGAAASVRCSPFRSGRDGRSWGS